MMTDIIGVYLCGVAAFSGAWMLRYHAEPRYRFASASLMMGAWLFTAGVAIEQEYKARVANDAGSVETGRHTVIASR